MPIKFPVHASGEPYLTLWDASGRAICGGLSREDAEEIVSALNVQPRKKSKKIQIEEALRRSDLTAQLAERDDIEWGHHDGLPRGEHVTRLKGVAND